MVKHRRTANVIQPPFRRGGVPLASEKHREQVRTLMQQVYVNKRFSRAIQTGLRNGTLTEEEVHEYFRIFREVQERRNQAALARRMSQTSVLR